MAKECSSFRDPSGFVFIQEGCVYRQINEVYRNNYELFISSGLFAELCHKSLIVSHQESAIKPFRADNFYKIIKPQQISFISYPFEWSFSQLKDAALLTLQIQKTSLEYGMSLKDASAYNIQFQAGRPVFIDTLSFEKYEEGSPWVAYRQFCQHFLAPLALMARKDIRLGHLLQYYLDGLPLDLVSRLLPFATWLSPPCIMHIHLHAKSITKHAATSAAKKTIRLSKYSLLAIIDSLTGMINKMAWQPSGTEWADYYEETNYSEQELAQKKSVVERYLLKVCPRSVWDFGGNTGYFTRLASNRGIESVCFDFDPAAVEKNYLAVKKQKEKHILPLLLDLTNPSPGLGWGNKERRKINERGRADMVLALALIHHLCIGSNVPLENVAEFLSIQGDYLIIEFVPKTDAQTQRLLTGRKDVYTEYCQDNFEKQFSRYYEIEDKIIIEGTCRFLYLMKALK